MTDNQLDLDDRVLALPVHVFAHVYANADYGYTAYLDANNQHYECPARYGASRDEAAEAVRSWVLHHFDELGVDNLYYHLLPYWERRAAVS